MLAEVQGALATSIWMVICPRLVFSTRSWVPEFAMPVVGGVPTFLRSGLGAAAGEALGSGLGAHTQENAAADAAGVAELFADGVDFLPPVLATISAMIPMTTTAVAAAPMMAPRLRRFWAAWARSAISRSRRARAAARWRSLSDDTVRNLPDGDLEWCGDLQLTIRSCWRRRAMRRPRPTRTAAGRWSPRARFRRSASGW